jgi:SOS-response transcriptional repressor LexA
MFPHARNSIQRTRFPYFEIVAAGGGKKKLVSTAKKIKLVAIPILPLHAATAGEMGDAHTDFDQIPAEQMLAAHPTWCPNPSSTGCLRVRGESMSPMIRNGDIVTVDYSQVDPSQLSGKIVVASHRDKGLSISRLVVANEIHMLQSENPEYEPIVVNGDRNWRIIGKVLWWIHQSP